MSGRRPADVSDELVDALGKASEASEYLIRARGSLYEFHQLMGHADLLLGEAADALASAGELDAARRLRLDIVGRNVANPDGLIEAFKLAARIAARGVM